jgi:alkylated DNA repair protein (DNA oxidative demethylase)
MIFAFYSLFRYYVFVTMSLFSHLEVEPTHEEIFPGAVLMRGLALPQASEFFAAVETVLEAAPLHHAATPTGLPMGVMVSDCGTPEAFRRRWDPANPAVRRLWPPVPRVLLDFSLRCAVRAGFPLFRPDTCHINRYEAGIKLGIHQDRHECEMSQPIVSISLGLECVFLLGGLQRTDSTKRILLEHGDVIVWGGPSRMRFHGVMPLKPGHHPMSGPYRYNLTFRKVAA